MSNLREQAINIARQFDLDFEIKKLPLFGIENGTAINESGELIDTEVKTKSDYFGLLNTKSGEIIHSVKGGYTPTQNVEVIEQVLMGMKGFGELSVQKAGSINGGRRTFIQLGIEGESQVNSDIVKRYITIIDSNDGSTGLSVGIGDLTMSCQNQFYQFYKEGNRHRHTISVVDKVREIHFMIGKSLNESFKLIELYRDMVATPASKELTRKLVKELTGVDSSLPYSQLVDMYSTKRLNAMEQLISEIRTETNDKGANLWGLHSGVTRWTTHSKSAPKRENGRLESSMLGTNYKTNQRSLEFAIANL